MTRNRPAADLLTDVAHIVEDDNGWAPIDEPDDDIDAVVNELGPVDEHIAVTPLPNRTGWLPKVPELDPRKRYPDEANPIFDKLDRGWTGPIKIDGKRSRGWTAPMRSVRVGIVRWKDQHQLEELAHRDRIHEIEHASDVLDKLAQR